MKITNTSDYGDVEVPLLRRDLVEAGETLDVTEDQARRLLPQRGNWSPADDEARAVVAEIDAAEADPSDVQAAQLKGWQAFVEQTAPQMLGENPVAPPPPFAVDGPVVLDQAEAVAPAVEGVPPAQPDPSIEPASTPAPVAPGPKAVKADWVTYVTALGLDPTGKTIPQLQQLAGTAQASNDQTEGESS